MERAHANVHSIRGGANLSISLQSFYAWRPVYTTNIHLFIDNDFLICQASHYPAEPLKSCLNPEFHASKGIPPRLHALPGKRSCGLPMADEF